MQDQHVVRREEGWGVKKEGGERASRIFATKRQAMEYARELTGKHGVCMVVHDSEGRFKEFDCAPSMGNSHVVPKDEHWGVLEAGGKLLKTFDNKDDAIEHAYSLAKSRQVCMVVHNKDGSIDSKECLPHRSAGSYETKKSGWWTWMT
jgi:hypothetical protein